MESDVRIQTGFTFKNVNAKKETADVTIDLTVGDYRTVFTVKQVRIFNLQRVFFLYARDQYNNEDSVLTLKKPYMEPFDFTEFGFTKNYLKELNLLGLLKILGIVR